jgi:hypothetical protein
MNDQDMIQIYQTWIEERMINQPNNPLEPLIPLIICP